MRLNLEFNVKIAVRTAVCTGLTFSSYRKEIACVDACGDRNRKILDRLESSLASAL